MFEFTWDNSLKYQWYDISEKTDDHVNVIYVSNMNVFFFPNFSF